MTAPAGAIDRFQFSSQSFYFHTPVTTPYSHCKPSVCVSRRRYFIESVIREIFETEQRYALGVHSSAYLTHLAFLFLSSREKEHRFS